MINNVCCVFFVVVAAAGGGGGGGGVEVVEVVRVVIGCLLACLACFTVGCLFKAVFFVRLLCEFSCLNVSCSFAVAVPIAMAVG